MISRMGQRRGRPVFSGGGNSFAMIIGIGQIASEKPKKVNLNRAAELVLETWLPEPLRPPGKAAADGRLPAAPRSSAAGIKFDREALGVYD